VAIGCTAHSTVHIAHAEKQTKIISQ